MTDSRLEAIARRHDIRPLSRAVEALREAHRLGVQDARRPLDPQRPGRRKYGAEPGEARQLAMMLTMRKNGSTWQAIADALDGMGWKRRNGTRWEATAVAGICEGLV